MWSNTDKGQVGRCDQITDKSHLERCDLIKKMVNKR